MKFTKQDIKQIEDKGLDLKSVENQLLHLTRLNSFVNLHSPATIGDGIIKFSEEESQYFATFFDAHKKEKSVIKFVPASGAASRMFKSLYTFLDNYDINKETINSYVNRTKSVDLFLFFVTVEKLPFHDEVFEALKNHFPEFKLLPLDKRRLLFVEFLLSKKYFDFGEYPKGLLPFHNYKTHISTAFEEHLVEASQYAAIDGNATLHFTISNQHQNQFLEHYNSIKKIVESKTNISFDISYSFQDSKTDTIAITLDHKPFKLDGKLLFRPSGHGALLHNLNAIDTDLIFIKNIDNVMMQHCMDEMVYYKTILGGYLLKIQSKAFDYAHQLDQANISEEKINEIANFLSDQMNVHISSEFEKYANHYKIEYLKSRIHRPIRVCGMVKNEGEPGGGPFWIKHENGELSLQIVEMKQINTKSESQNKIIKSATHFNPVDIVCGVRNYKGEKYDLNQFVDAKTHFVAIKNKYGKKLKTLERPGLWNGGMALWNTVFVEVPLSTFNPVKKVHDLLKAPHQLEV
ncbi:MAG: DUF4301 family protein [Flavobacteriaceae bacterium]